MVHLRCKSMAAAVAVACGWPLLAAGQSAAPVAVAANETPVTLESVVVKGQALRGTQAPYSSTVFSTESIRGLQVSQPQELFRWVPGMNVRNYGLGAVADSITLRGFSGGGHGGDIGMVIDGIPLNEAMSHADGYADLNVVIPLEIDALTVFHGPVSPLYGNYNRGGLIVIDTRKSGTYRQADFSVGSDTTGDAQVALGVRLAPGQQLNLAAQAYRTDGFRPQSDTWRTTFAGRWTVDVSSALQLALSTRLHAGEGDSAAYLTPAQFAVDPYGIDPRVQNDGAEKHYGTLRADANYLINPQLKLLSFVYGTKQDFTRYYTRGAADPAATWAQREETYDRDVFGAGFNLNGQAKLAGGTLNWVGGVETFRESTDYRYYDNLDHRARVQPAIYDRKTSLDSVSAFGEVEAPIHPLFKPTLGARYDRFSGDCTRKGAETGSDPCADLVDIDHLSPKIGLRSDVLPQLELRASWSEGFALPSNFIKYALEASNLDPNVFRQTEVGAIFRLADRFKADVAWYRIKSSQEIRTVSPGVYENYGATKRDGVEASVEWTPLDDLRVALSWASADSEVTENASAGLLGKKVAGVPRQMSTLGVSWAPPQGWGASATVRDVGRYAVDAANSAYYDGYTTLDLGVSYVGRFDALRYRAYLRIDNALDKVYATNYSTTVAPGAPRSFRLGAQLDF